MKRTAFDLSHLSHECGKIDRLKVLDVFTAAAGDSVQIDFQGAFRLSPLERALTLDARIDIAAFAIPHRHIYGFDTWSAFIRDGEAETITFPHVDNSATESASHAPSLAYLGVGDLTNIRQIPKWLVEGYNRIRGRFFINPGASHADDLNAEFYTDDLPGSADGDLYGREVSPLRTPWTTGMNGTRSLETAQQRNVQGEVVAGQADRMDVIDITAARAMLGRMTTREYYGRRHVDLIRQIWGGNVSADADERPIMLGRTTAMMSGYDINGTDEHSLGSYKGKADTTARLFVPLRFCPEHCSIFVVGVMRFPICHKSEIQYLARNPNPTYDELAADPILLRTMARAAVMSMTS
ncbi:MAG: hypothetical protein MPJ78_20445, partial [Hyphomicrobiaceae bacterium]|nr:hypothetical protein [Hyphomicrobiaceae bacterium]